MRAGVRARVYLVQWSPRFERLRNGRRAVGGGLGAAKGLPMAAVPKSRRARAAVLPFPGPASFAVSRSSPGSAVRPRASARVRPPRAGALAYLGARETSIFALRTVQIDGAPPRVAAHVEQALAPLQGRSLLALNQGEVEQRLARLSDVAAVLVRPRLPAHAACVRDTGSFDRRPPARHARPGSSRATGASSERPVCLPHRRLPRVWIPRGDDRRRRHDRLPMPMQPTPSGRSRCAKRAGSATRIATSSSRPTRADLRARPGPRASVRRCQSLPLKLASPTDASPCRKNSERLPRRHRPHATDRR